MPSMLQCMSPEMAPFGVRRGALDTSGVGGEADVGRTSSICRDWPEGNIRLIGVRGRWGAISHSQHGRKVLCLIQ
jgi:hypothetical protein